VFPTFDIMTRLDGLIMEMARLGPALPVALVFAVALIEAIVLPSRYWAKAAWVVAVLLCGAVAAMLLHREQHALQGDASGRLAAEAAALRGLWAQWDVVAKTLPPAPAGAGAASFETPDDAIASLSAQQATISRQIAALKAGAVARSIDPATAAKLADYLKQYGSYRAVVSCVPGDVEAYGYANQLVGILKQAGWDAGGPEATENVVDQPAMGVTVLVRDPSAADAAKILNDAFTQFNIPHQPGIAADYAIPDTATVELFVARKP
jgi:hypothetical protein